MLSDNPYGVDRILLLPGDYRDEGTKVSTHNWDTLFGAHENSRDTMVTSQTLDASTTKEIYLMISNPSFLR